MKRLIITLSVVAYFSCLSVQAMQGQKQYPIDIPATNPAIAQAATLVNKAVTASLTTIGNPAFIKDTKPVGSTDSIVLQYLNPNLQGMLGSTTKYVFVYINLSLSSIKGITIPALKQQFLTEFNKNIMIAQQQNKGAFQLVCTGDAQPGGTLITSYANPIVTIAMPGKPTTCYIVVPSIKVTK